MGVSALDTRRVHPLHPHSTNTSPLWRPLAAGFHLRALHLTYLTSADKLEVGVWVPGHEELSTAHASGRGVDRGTS